MDASSHSWADIEERVAGGIVARRDPAVFTRGAGAYLFDADGNRYLDFTSAQGIALLGHAHPIIAQAIAEQAATLMSLPSFFYGEARGRFLHKLSGILPAHLRHVYLCNCGTESIEIALKLARLTTERSGLVAASKGFHGRTTGSLALSWLPKGKDQFAPLMPDVTHVKYNQPADLATAVTENTAALFLEAIQGEGGVNVGTDEYLQQAQARCRAVGALLVMDEIQTGLGRAGAWFCHQQAGLEPDIMCLAKGLGAGFPMGAVAFSDAVQERLFLGAHGSTFGGNPLACAAGAAALTAYQDLNLIPHARRMGAELLAALRERLGPLKIVREVRGRGLIIGIELRTRAAPFMKALMKEHRLLVLNAGPRVLRLLPPLIIERAHAQTAVDAVARVLKEAS